MFRTTSRPVTGQRPALRAVASSSRAAALARRAVCPAARHASTSAGPASTSRVSTLFYTLIGIGVATTAYGVYEFYTLFTLWPKEVRSDLRAAIKAKNQGNLGKSERFLIRALETARKLPLEQFGAEPHLKLSGIAIALAAVQEDNAKPQQAYDTYVGALEGVRAAITEGGVSGRERLRAVAIAHKLGEMAEMYHQPEDVEEGWLVYAVEELLRTLRDERNLTQRVTVDGKEQDEQRAMLDELELPPWVVRMDVVAPLQALGRFYNQRGKQEYAVPLYLSALNVMLPPGQKSPSAENRCKGADLMNSLADSLVLGAPTPDRLKQAEAWVNKALAVIDTAKKENSDEPENLAHCDLVLAAALFNKASMREMAGDLDGAKNAYTESQKQSFLLKERDGVMQADAALRRLERLSKAKESNTDK